MPIVPTMPWRIAQIHVLPNYCLEVTFIDGTKGKVDMSQFIMSKESGVFSALNDLAVFNQARVEYGAVTWPGEIDLAPDAIYKEIKKNHLWILS